MSLDAFVTVLSQPEVWLFAVLGGALGALVGALPALALSGIAIVVGELQLLIDGDLGGPAGVLGADPGQIGLGITGSVGLGPLLGPHVAFAGGVAAAAYGARRGYLGDPRREYYPAKQLTEPVGLHLDALVVGAVFGVLGLVLRHVSGTLLALPWDPIMASVILSGLFVRLAFGFPVIGRVRGSGLFDMSPFERGRRRTGFLSEGTADGGRTVMRYAVEPWQPAFYRWPMVAGLGIGVGLVSGLLVVATDSVFLPFGLAMASLGLVFVDDRRIPVPIPVVHHVALVASLAAAASLASGDATIAGAEAPTALAVAAGFGLVAALLAEGFQRVFYAHGDTNWDPPAAAIVGGSLILAACVAADILPTTLWVPLPV